MKRLFTTALLLVGMNVYGVNSNSNKFYYFSDNTAIEIRQQANGNFGGIGDIIIEGIHLNLSEKPMMIEIVGREDKYNVSMQPSPVKYNSQLLRSVKEDANQIIVSVDLIDQDGNIDSLQIVFRYVSEKFYEVPVVGIEYHFIWSSNSRYAHQVRENSCWTFGESIEGIRWISQNSGYGRGSYDFIVGKDTHIGGEEPYDKIVWGDIRDETLQNLKDRKLVFGYLTSKEARETRLGDGDFVTFLSDEKKDISFIRYASHPTMNYWQFERLPFEKHVRFEEWYCVTLAKNIKTTPISVKIMKKSGVNAWLIARENVQRKLLNSANMPYYPPVPWVAYTQYGIDDPGELKKQVPYQQALEIMKKYGIKEYWWYGPWKSNWSEVSKMTKEEIEKHKLYSHSVWDYDWADNKYNIPALKELMNESKKYGIEPVIWTTQTMSQISPHVITHPDWALRRIDGSLFNYMYPDLVGMNHASGYSDFLVNRISSRMMELSFNNLWLDSFFFSGDKLDWMDVNITPNLLAAIETTKKLRNAGVKRIYNELNCPLLIASSTGVLNKEDLDSGNNLHLLYNMALCDHSKFSADNYFKMLAFKCCPQPYLDDYISRPEFAEEISYINKAYVKALPLMYRCEVLDNNKGVLYWDENKEKAIVFSFCEDIIDIDGKIKTVREILFNDSLKFEGTSFRAKKYKVYMIELF